MSRKRGYKRIKTLNDIKRKKQILDKKARIREKILRKRINSFTNQITPRYLYNEAIRGFKLEDTMLGLLPHAMRLKEPIREIIREKIFGKGVSKKILITLFSGIGAALTSMFMYRNKSKKSSKKEYYEEDQMFI